MYFHEGNVFLISEPIDDQPATRGNGSTVGFAIKSPEQGDEWHEAGINNGGTTRRSSWNQRGNGHEALSGLFKDPSGNKLCALLNL